MRLLMAAVVALAAPATSTASVRPNLRHGKVLFVAACGSCHTLAAAGTHGRKGPDLGQEASSYAEALDQVIHGGGGMPAFGKSLTNAQTRDIAAFVAHATAGAGDD